MIAVATLWLAVSVFAATSTQVYRCPQGDGGVALQDVPCPAHPEIEPRTLTAPAGEAPRLQPQPAAAPERGAESAAQPISVVPRGPPPQLWRCVDFERHERIADHDDPRGRYVPLWVLGVDPRAPMRIFGDEGRPAPTPASTQPGAPQAGTVEPMVWMQDHCEPLSPEESCALLAAEFDGMGRRIYNAAPADKRDLERRRDGLKVRLRTGCGGA